MAYGVVVKSQVMATNVDSLNRSAIYASADSEDGNIYRLDSIQTTAGQLDVWTATAPSTGSLNNLWMQQDFGVVLTNEKYRGLNDDPRNYLVPDGDIFSVFKPQPGDILLMSEDAFSGAKSTNTYANAANAGIQLVWGATQTASALSLLYRATSYISIGIGSSVSNRITAYKMEVIAN